jgi:CBS-domain-containing membrane protein
MNPWDRRVALLLAGANWRERLIAGAGAVIGIGLCAAISTLAVPSHGLLLAAPLGASAVLLFAVPSSRGRSSAAMWSRHWSAWLSHICSEAARSRSASR